MLQIGGLNTRTDLFILWTAALVLIIQLFLCFQLKSLWLRLSPCLLFGVATVALGVTAFFFDGWNRFSLLLIAAFFVIFMLACGVAWGIWAIIKWILRKIESKE